MIHTRLRQIAFVLTAAAIMSACTGAEARKSSFIARGEQYMATHDWQKARLEFRNALQIDPKIRRCSGLRRRPPSELVSTMRRRVATARFWSRTRATWRRALHWAACMPAAGWRPRPSSWRRKVCPHGPTTRDCWPYAVLHGRCAATDMGAQQDAEAALARAPADANAAVLMASLLQRQGRGEEGLPLLLRASAAVPGYVGLRVVWRRRWRSRTARGG